MYDRPHLERERDDDVNCDKTQDEGDKLYTGRGNEQNFNAD